jgi:hypothetical protein
LLNLMGLSGKGSLYLPLMLQGGDHTGLQAAFGDLQVTVQAIDQINQQLLLRQLTSADPALQDPHPVLVIECQLATAKAVGRTKLGLVWGKGVVEQSADSFHPDHSLAKVRGN